jgi:hypothetical protein
MSEYNSPVNRPRVALTTGATAQEDPTPMQFDLTPAKGTP